MAAISAPCLNPQLVDLPALLALCNPTVYQDQVIQIKAPWGEINNFDGVAPSQMAVFLDMASRFGWQIEVKPL